MSRLEDSKTLHEFKDNREKMQQIAKDVAQKEYNQILEQHDAIIEARKKKYDNYYKFIDNVKKTFLTEALNKLYLNCFKNPTVREQSMGEALIGNYINENTVNGVIKSMRFSNNRLLKNIYSNINKYSNTILEEADPEKPETQTIDKSNIDNFWKDVDNSDDIADATNIIRLRVSNAEEDFVNKNQQDKANIDSILQDTAERIQAAKDTNDNDYSDEVEESETRLAKDKIYHIQHEANRSVFDRMVRAIAESVIKDDLMRPRFVEESGRLNMDSIVESARCMYTLLEMISTLGIEKVDNEYIENTINSIK